MAFKLKKGLVQIYTGVGKGKTTAAIGQAIRSLGQGYKILFIEFFKHYPSSETKIFKKLKIDYLRLCPFYPTKYNKEEIKKEFPKEWARLKETIKREKYDLIILDEINIGLNYKLLAIEDLIDCLKTRHCYTEIILTGQKAPKKLIEFADLVTEMKKIKHPFDKGIKARRGIEY